MRQRLPGADRPTILARTEPRTLCNQRILDKHARAGATSIISVQASYHCSHVVNRVDTAATRARRYARTVNAEIKLNGARRSA